MREYTIKRGYNPDLNKIVKEFFNVNGDLNKGLRFYAEGIGEVYIKRNGRKILIETKTKAKKGDPTVIKKWNDFLFKATGKTAKERKKELLKS